MDWNVGSIALVGMFALIWACCAGLVFCFMHVKAQQQSFANTNEFNRIGTHVLFPQVFTYVFGVFLALIGPLTIAIAVLSLVVWVVAETAVDVRLFVRKRLNRRRALKLASGN